VAERLVARSGDEAYGSLSLLVEAYARAQVLGLVRPGSFRPPPKVDSAFVGFDLRPPPLPESEMPAFIALVRLAFSQRRKTLRNALGSGWGKERAAQVLAASGMPERARAEELGMAEFLRLYGEWRRSPM
jgi:16S rRNA (adenine1518-N6/adenine1519-N6)-dimethyltransferase